MNTFLISDTPVADVFSYDPNSGQLTWKVSPVPWVRVGDVAGSTRKDGYVEIGFEGKSYLAHRLAYAIYHGYMPYLVDHIDRNPSNNRISNLREFSKKENAYNTGLPANNTSGHKGVSWCKNVKKWTVRFKHEGRYLFGGYFVNLEDAVARRKQFEQQYLGGVQ